MPNYRHLRRLDKLKALFEKVGIRPHSKMGQNFLLDKNQVMYIARVGALEPRDLVLEVGPGTAFLTQELAPSGATVLCVELDHKLLEIAREETKHFPNVIIMQGDILERKNEINYEVVEKIRELLELRGPGTVLKSVSNLPYSAGTPFMANMFSSPLPWSRAVFLLQHEVAQRVTASPGTAAYGTLSITAALGGKATIERKVPPQVFWPRPRVTSAVLAIDFNSVEERMKLPWKELRQVTSAIFRARRKNLRNAFKGIVEKEETDVITARMNLDPEIRGEMLTPEQILAITREVGARFIR